MGKQIRNKSDLPKWFNLEKYAGAGSLDTLGWYEQLSMRNDLRRTVGSPRWKSWQTDVEPSIGLQQTLSVLALIRETPILIIEGNKLLEYFFYEGLVQKIKARDPRYSIGVHLSTVRNLYMKEGNIEKFRQIYARYYFGNLFKKISNSHEIFSSMETDWIDEPVDKYQVWPNSKVDISVNTLLPDNVLIEQFKEVLYKLRHPLPGDVFAIKKTRKPAFADWINFGVLPYLDLQIWQQQEEVKITNHLMADVIFPEGEGGEEVVRKTTARMADELLTFDHRMFLQTLAAHEIAETNTL